MAVQKINNAILYGVAADTKPTTYANNTLFFVQDTGDVYRWNLGTTTWVLLSGASKTETLTNKTIAASSNSVSGIVDANIGTHTTTKITTTSKSLLNSAIVYNDQANTFGAFAQIFPSSQLKIQNPGATFNYIVAGSALAADRTLTLPLLTGNDQVTTDAFTTTLTNKTIAAGSNTITGIADANITAHTTTKITTTSKSLLNSSIVYNDQANTFGAFAQVFPNSQLKIANPAATFNYIVASGAITADRTVSFPVLTGADTFDFQANTATLTNKTLVAASNTITDTSATTGDILRHDGTRFVRLARGSANQVLTTNSGATDIAWAAAAGGGYTETKGTKTASGDASTVIFTQAHSITGTPTWASVDPTSNDADSDFYVTVDATNITITYPFAPPSGTNNLTFFWRATQ